MTRFVVLGFIVAAMARPAEAQDRLTVFLHGFNSNAASWADTASRLEGRLQITKALPDLPWFDRYEAQATHLDNLANGVGAPRNMVLVGHSNGGLVARQLSTKRSLGGIVTLGSPHHGVPLAKVIHGVAEHYLFIGDKLNLFLSMMGALGGTNQYTGVWFSPGLAPVRAAVTTLGQALWFTYATIHGAIGPLVAAPVLADMVPGSAVLNDLNSASNTSRESATVPGRVGLVFAAREWWVGAPLVAGAPSHQYTGDAAVRAGIHYLELIASYFASTNFLPTDPFASSVTALTRSIISDLLMYNATWCGATAGRLDCSISTDGVVPTESQFFPGNATNVGFYGPAHITEKQGSENYIYDALTKVIRIQPRGDAGGEGGSGGVPVGSTLSAGERLYPDHEIRSPSSTYALRYQSDGNLVLYGPDGPVWDSGTAGMGGLHCEMQPDGNFVIYHANGGEPWSTGTGGLPGAELRVQDDGYIVIYDAGNNVPWWAPPQ